MWVFKGKYSGEAKAYIKEKEKKKITIFSLIYSILILLIFVAMAILLGNGNITLIIIILGVGVGTIAFANLVLFLVYKREPQCAIEITNDGFNVYDGNVSVSFALYKIEPIEYYDDFIVISNQCVLQKELLVEGDWEELKILLKKIEDSLESDDPMYQIEEPPTEFFEATVKEKRIYQKFVGGVSAVTPVGLFHYFATFELENDKEVEYEIGQEAYEK